jgi:hypothetical protein
MEKAKDIGNVLMTVPIAMTRAIVERQKHSDTMSDADE